MSNHQQGAGGAPVNKRISLVEGIRRDQEAIDPVTEQNFLKYGTVKPPIPNEPAEEPAPVRRTYEPRVEERPLRRARSSKVTPVGLIPVTVRLRPEIAGALKRASLERQLAGEELFTQQDIVEQALEPWLRQEGLLS
jgi:hypothetical protein